MTVVDAAFKRFAAPPPPRSAPYKYGFLTIILILTAWRLLLDQSHPMHHWDSYSVLVALLLNHLAYQFRWPVMMTALLRIVAWEWIIYVGWSLLMRDGFGVR